MYLLNVERVEMNYNKYFNRFWRGPKYFYSGIPAKPTQILEKLFLYGNRLKINWYIFYPNGLSCIYRSRYWNILLDND